MNNRQPSLLENQRMSMDEAIETSIASLNAYGQDYKHWSIAYSGGKDSTATVSFVVWAIRSGRVQAPETLTVLYADTRQELPVLNLTALRFLDDLRQRGIDARVVLPEIDHRFYVYMLGRGVPPPSNTFRWCTERIKIKPMMAALNDMHQEHGQRFLQITGVRLGESAVRDQRIAISCTSNKGECGQGWFQQMSSESISDTLAPLVHWRLCFVWDWIYFYDHGFPYLAQVAAAYGDGDARTGCIGCMLASRDVALENMIAEDATLKPLLEIRPLLEALKQPKSRIRKATPERTKAGRYAKNGQRMGPLTMEARARGLERLLDIQARAGVDLVNAEEEARIRQLWAENTWPDGWEGGLEAENHIRADVPIDQISVIGDDELIIQTNLL
ncbi:MAG: phosphoadenosine phosphosulfate reductase family protein [Anaerolineae bacterium]|nr:phosphoadenosine phosphosulfate reductase family protein [Anaerolineae bacterium]